MKRGITIVKIFLVLILLLSLSMTVFAHPGNTDSKGGHHDYNNQSGLGYYHYHHGKPAHLHENGLCPYEKSAEPKVESKNNYPRENPNKNYGVKIFSEISKTLNEPIPYWVEILIGVFCVCLFFVFFEIVISITDEIKSSFVAIKKRKKEKVLLKLSEKSMYDYYFSCYAFFRPSDFSQMPKGSYIKDAMPCTHGGGKYGEYTVYITPTGMCYHEKKVCTRSNKTAETNIVLVQKTHKPCSKCCKSRIDISWYEEYKRIYDIKKKYMIP